MTGWLVDTLFATSALMLLVLILRQPVREKFGSRAAYALWLLPAGRALMPTITETVTRTVPAPAPMLPAAAPASPIVALEPQYLGAVTPADTSIVDAFGGWPTIAMVLWVGVAAGLLIRGLAEYRTQRADILNGAVQLARIGSIRLVRTPAVAGPLAFGLIDRVIAVPADFERRFDDRERCLALDHELAHHRHLDLYTNAFAFVLLSLQWFNPLAWWSYAAFRFDQEAACDARVLDKAKPNDRADYGRAIAKAASGRALLLASALDQKKTLHRRLKSMLNDTPKTRRIGATAMIVAAAAVALPLTATRAIEYVDVAAPEAPDAPIAPKAPLVQAALVTAPEAPDAPDAPAWSDDAVAPADGKSGLWIEGKKMDLHRMTAEQRAEARRELAKARAEIDQECAEAEAELAKAKAELSRDAQDHHRDMAEARKDVAEALREIDVNAAEIRKAGQDPEALKRTVRQSLASLDAIDFEKIRLDALNAVDPNIIKASLRSAEASLAAVEAELDRLDRIDREKRR